MSAVPILIATLTVIRELYINDDLKLKESDKKDIPLKLILN